MSLLTFLFLEFLMLFFMTPNFSAMQFRGVPKDGGGSTEWTVLSSGNPSRAQSGEALDGHDTSKKIFSIDAYYGADAYAVIFREDVDGELCALKVRGIAVPYVKSIHTNEALAGKLIARYVATMVKSSKELYAQNVEQLPDRVKKKSMEAFVADVFIKVQDDQIINLAQHLIERGFAQQFVGEEGTCWNEENLQEIIRMLRAK